MNKKRKVIALLLLTTWILLSYLRPPYTPIDLNDIKTEEEKFSGNEPASLKLSTPGK